MSRLTVDVFMLVMGVVTAFANIWAIWATKATPHHWRTRLTPGVCLLLLGSATAFINIWAMKTIPQYWGTPNIGGGGLLVLSYITAAYGLYLIGNALFRRRNERRTHL